MTVPQKINHSDTGTEEITCAFTMFIFLYTLRGCSIPKHCSDMNRPDKIQISPSFMLAVPNKITYSASNEGLKTFLLKDGKGTKRCNSYNSFSASLK